MTGVGERVGVILDGLWHNVTGSYLSKVCLARTQPYMGGSAISFGEIWGGVLVLCGHVTRVGMRFGWLCYEFDLHVCGSDEPETCLARTQTFIGRSAISFSEIGGGCWSYMVT